MTKIPGAGINYRDTYFQFPQLEIILGEPTSDTLLTLKDKINVNATSVPSYLSNLIHGFLSQ